MDVRYFVGFLFSRLLLASAVFAFCGAVNAQEVGELEAIEVKGTDSDEELEAETAETEEEDAPEEKTAEELENEKLDKELKELRRERDFLSVRNGIRSEEAKAAIAAMREEKALLALQNGLFMEKVKTELIEQRGALDRMSAEIDAVNKQISLGNSKARLESQLQLAEMKQKEGLLTLENSLMQKETGIELERLRLAETKLKLRRTELDTAFAELQGKLSILEKENEVADHVYAEIEQVYMAEPVVDGVLHISDRRIALNGPIWAGTSSYVSERINYFNNQNPEHPIFLVIDSSPGGSVWAGYRILKAMEGSKAPVYVVVKSYAASMAAIITTLAERSYAYENALILHHELSWYGSAGNLSQQKEYAEEATEWWRRVASPVAKKMGVTLSEFRTLMYEKSAAGDWQEFADVAQQYNWVDTVVDKIWETSIDRNPDRFGKQFWAMDGVEELRDENGRAYVELPRLESSDFYFLYDPQGYYRMPR